MFNYFTLEALNYHHLCPSVQEKGRTIPNLSSEVATNAELHVTRSSTPSRSQCDAIAVFSVSNVLTCIFNITLIYFSAQFKTEIKKKIQIILECYPRQKE